MKKVFIGISLLAIVYLGLQSGLANNISLPKWDTVFSQTQIQEAQVVAVDLALKTEIQELKQKMQLIQAENKALTNKLANLETKIEFTQLNTQIAYNQGNKNTDTDKAIDIAQVPVSMSASTHVPIANKADTDSNKRLQQQALLRSVAHTMELSALSSLSK